MRGELSEGQNTMEGTFARPRTPVDSSKWQRRRHSIGGLIMGYDFALFNNVIPFRENINPPELYLLLMKVANYNCC